MLNTIDPFSQLAGLTEHTEETVRYAAHLLAGQGLPVLLVQHGGKAPAEDLRTEAMVETDRTTRPEAYKSDGNPRGGVYLATTDQDRLDGYITRYLKEHGEVPNLAVAPAEGSPLVIMDADTPAQVEWARRDLGVGEPTVATPGSQAAGHSGGGHWYWRLPKDMGLPPGSKFDVHADSGEEGVYYSVLGVGAYVLVPPSARAEGMYRMTGQVQEAPEKLVEELAARGERRARAQAAPVTSQVDVRQLSPLDARYSKVSWDSVLLPQGFTRLPYPAACGCPQYLRPGKPAGSTEARSCVGHEPGCTESTVDTSNGSGPLTVWSSTLASELAGVATGDGDTVRVTKAQVEAHYYHDDNMGALMAAHGLSSHRGAQGFGSLDVPVPTVTETDPQPTPPDEEETAPVVDSNMPRMVRRRNESEGAWRARCARVEQVRASEEAIYGQAYPNRKELLATIFSATPQLRLVYQVARHRRVSPMSLLLEALPMVGHCAPACATVESWAPVPLGLFHCGVGESGEGKSAVAVARADLAKRFDVDLDEFATGTPLDDEGRETVDPAASVQMPASGEVLVSVFTRPLTKDEAEALRVKGKLPHATLVGDRALLTHPVITCRSPEMSGLLATGNRNNSTLFPELITAFDAARLGTMAVSRGGAESPALAPGSYRLYLSSQLQPSKSAQLLDNADLGLLQRWIFTEASTHLWRDDDPTGVEPVGDDVRICPPHGAMNSTEFVVTLPEEALADLERWVDEQATATMATAADPTSEANNDFSHRGLLTMRVAAHLALMHGSMEVTPELWRVARLVMGHHAVCVQRLRIAAGHAKTRASTEKGQSRHEEKQAEARAAEQGLSRYAEDALAKLAKAGALPRAEVHRRVKKTARAGLTKAEHNQAWAMLLAEGNIVVVGADDKSRDLYAVAGTPAAEQAQPQQIASVTPIAGTAPFNPTTPAATIA